MHKKGWIVYKEEDAIKNKVFIEWFKKECAKQQMDLSLILREKLSIGIIDGALSCIVENKRAILPDFVIIRTIEPLLNRQFELLGIPSFNNSHVATICNDKAKTHQLLASHNIPMTDTLFLKTADFKTDTIPFSFPFILKTVEGRGGKEVFWVIDEKNLRDITQKLHFQSVIIQKPCSQVGKDLRVFVVGKEIVGSILRENPSDFKANYSLGGNAQLYHLNKKEEQLVHKIIDLFDFGMVGIDFLFDDHGVLLLNEIEDVVGSRTLSAKSSINIIEKYVTYIKSSLI